jgi:DNA-binding LacI/PurR family transcriptional regulator
MLKILIAFDAQDADLGNYFTTCKDDLLHHSNAHGIGEVICFDGKTGTTTTIIDHISNFEECPFIFVSYAHGREDAILLNAMPVIDLSTAYFFGTSLFYACSCRAAVSLGKMLIENANCRAFIGFTEDAMLASIERYDAIFMACDNYGIKHFLEGNSTLKESFEAMKAFYTEQLDDLYSINAVAASYLLDNRNALVLLPENSPCTLSDFYSS